MASISKQKLLILLCIFKFVLPFLLESPVYELQRDEYLYLEQGNHLAWGFLEVPPMLPFFAWISNLFGASFFWIKFWPSLFGTATLYLTGRMILDLGGRSFALVLATLCMATAAYLRVNFLFQPNSLDIFFWTALSFCFFRYIKTGKEKYIYWAGACIGFGMLAKYSMLFITAAFFIGLLLTKHRNLFLKKQIYLAAVFALLICFPNLLWQYQHKFPIIHHMEELQQSQLQIITPFRFLLEQLLMNVPVIMVWLAGLWFILVSGTGKPYRIFGFVYLSILLILLLGRGKGYYALGAYPILFAFGSYYFESLVPATKRLFRYALVMLIFVLALPILPVAIAVWPPEKLERYYRNSGLDKSGALRWEDGVDHSIPQDFADMLGWKEMSAKVIEQYKLIPDSTKEQTLIYCRNYGQAGAVGYYTRNSGLPKIHTDNGSFLFWMPDDYKIRNLLLIAEDEPGKDDEVFQAFGSVQLLDSVTNPFSREYATKIYLYSKPTGKVDSLIRNSIARLKSSFIENAYEK